MPRVGRPGRPSALAQSHLGIPEFIDNLFDHVFKARHHALFLTQGLLLPGPV